MRNILTIGLLLLAGCESRPEGDLPKLFPAKGKVTRGDMGIGGSIRLQSAGPESNPDLIITAELKPDGSFELSTLHAVSQKKQAGAPAGSYRITYNPPLGDQTTAAVSSMEPITLTDTFNVQEGPNDWSVKLGD